MAEILDFEAWPPLQLRRVMRRPNRWSGLTCICPSIVHFWPEAPG